jgi:[ribosomal protein S5]-alanine N-acetyltransferase
MIQTTRCELVPLILTDWDLVRKLYTNAEVRRFLGGVIDEKTIHLKFLQMLESGTETHHWIIRVKENSLSEEIGLVSLGQHYDNINTEISYQLLPQWWGKGFGTEAIQAVITHALTVLGLPRVIAETQITNVASCRLLERIGMHLEQTVERFGAKQGIFTT